MKSQRCHATPRQAYMLFAAAELVRIVKVTITNAALLASNAVSYMFGSSCDLVNFGDNYLRMSDGKEPNIGLLISTSSGPESSLSVGNTQGLSCAYGTAMIR